MRKLRKTQIPQPFTIAFPLAILTTLLTHTQTAAEEIVSTDRCCFVSFVSHVTPTRLPPSRAETLALPLLKQQAYKQTQSGYSLDTSWLHFFFFFFLVSNSLKLWQRFRDREQAKSWPGKEAAVKWPVRVCFTYHSQPHSKRSFKKHSLKVPSETGTFLVRIQN